MRRDYLLYAGATVVFGAVVLWASEAGWEITAIAAVVAVVLLLAAALTGGRTPTVLVVGERDGERRDDLREALRTRGFRVEICPGPGNSPCPVTLGKPCPAHGSLVAAVVIRHPDETGPLPPCGEAFRIPELAVEGSSDRDLEVVGRYGRVGADRGPGAVTSALDRLLETGRR